MNIIKECFFEKDWKLEDIRREVSASASSSASVSATTAEYNGFGKVSRLTERPAILRPFGNATTLSFLYGPDRSRWKTELKKGTKLLRTTLFGEDYEQVEADGVTTRYLYAGHGVVYVSRKSSSGSTGNYYYMVTDHLGSVHGLLDADGNRVLSWKYDAWGQQETEKTSDALTFYRGYGGHEMLPEFGLINMNGRLYDPALGRFLSPDNYVQLPDFSQSFNRYSYCLNNPLKYTDPSGELFGIDDMLLFGIISGAMMGAASAHMHGGSILKGAFLGAASAAVPYGIGSAFGHGLGSVGHELLRAGAHGLANGALNAVNGGKFGAGLLSGFVGSFAGSGAQALGVGRLGILGSSALGGGLGSVIGGGNWMSGMQTGLSIGMYNHNGKKNPQTDSYWLDEVVVTAPSSLYLRKPLYYGNIFLDNIGNSLKKKVGNSTVGDNGHFYWHAKGERGFYGNQYVKTYSLTEIGKRLTKVTGKAGGFISGYDIGYGMYQDLSIYKETGQISVYNTIHASAEAIGGIVVGKIGFELGCVVGAGCIPGVIIGGATGGTAGTIGGSYLGGILVDYFYSYGGVRP